LVLNGVVAGIGAILGFVPQIFVLFLLLGILEDSGYMARVAFVMDHIFRRFGLSGKSFIPMLIASGCGVPGIMATRTIEQERDRKITIMVTTFMPCSAKLPIIALVSGAFFPHASWVAPSAYFLGMSMIILSGIILKKTRM
ncbi:ferrous iron transport protein B, partial [Xanthomonas citri pv. citri]|nr:ferrous iron transport protein B [Xanthomonas citri pv. citri]